ncbi:MAG: KH domain-containing protein [Parcubacteria group bacterium]|nr:KH domain-containing protein [Parcubacteria group bacterium]
MADKEFDQEFVEYIVRGIVNNPDDVKTERIVDERGVLITLHINQEDMGYVIGRQGQTARAVRTLLKIVGAKENARVNLKIYEPEGSRRPPRRTDDEQPRRQEDDRAPVESVNDDFGGSDDDTSVDDLGI